MAGVNKVIIIGNLGKDPELRHTPQGMAVANFPVATSESWTDKSGQKQERTEWHRIVVWGKQAELCSKYLGKGRKVFVEGRLQTRSWDDKDGQKRYTTEIIANSIQFLDSANVSDRASLDSGSDPFGTAPNFEDSGMGPGQNSGDDIPF